MNQEQKIAIIVKMLEAASKEMKSQKISKETLLAGFNGYITKWNPPETPFDPANNIDNNNTASAIIDNILLFKPKK